MFSCLRTKKFFLIFSFIIFNVSLFAEIPYFLDNWIIPENDDLLNFTFESDDEDISVFNLKDYDYGRITVKDLTKLPPYFIENNLITEHANLNDILTSFNKLDDWCAEKKIQISNPFTKNPDGCYTLNKSYSVSIYSKNNPNYSLCVFFDNNYLAKTFEISYSVKNTVSSNLDSYNNCYKAEWESLSLSRKQLYLLTEPFFVLKLNDYNVEFDNNFYHKTTVEKQVELLKDEYGVYDKASLLEVLNNYFNAKEEEYTLLLNTLSKYNNTDINDILIAENPDSFKAHQLCYTYDVKDFLGKDGINAYLNCTKLSLIRTASNLNYISPVEADKLAKPIIKEVLNSYADYTDYAARFFIAKNIFEIRNTYKYYEYSFDTELYSVLNLKEYLYNIDGIKFNQNKNKKYKSADFENVKISFSPITVDLSIVFDFNYISNYSEYVEVNQYRKKYPQFKFIAEYINNIFDLITASPTSKNFYENKCKDAWNMLDETERYAIVFSSNLFELTYLNHYDMYGTIETSHNDGIAVKLLNDPWDVYNHDELISKCDWLLSKGHHAEFNQLASLLEKHSDKTVGDVIKLEGLTIEESYKLYYVASVKDKLGFHGIEAWDEGRAITLIRWGLGAGYISYEEAMTYIEPIITKIRNNYFNAEDYFAHYITGRGFLGLESGRWKIYLEDGLEYQETASYYFPLDTLVFEAKNADKNGIMKYEDVYYKPCDEALDFQELIFKIGVDENYKKSIAATEAFIEKYPEYVNIYTERYIPLLMSDGQIFEAIDVIEDYMDRCSDGLYIAESQQLLLYEFYLYSLLQIGQINEVLDFYINLKPEMQQDNYLCYFSAIALYQYAVMQTNKSQAYQYLVNAAGMFYYLKCNGFNIGNFEELLEELGYNE